MYGGVVDLVDFTVQMTAAEATTLSVGHGNSDTDSSRLR